MNAPCVSACLSLSSSLNLTTEERLRFGGVWEVWTNVEPVNDLLVFTHVRLVSSTKITYCIVKVLDQDSLLADTQNQMTGTQTRGQKNVIWTSLVTTFEQHLCHFLPNIELSWLHDVKLIKCCIETEQIKATTSWNERLPPTSQTLQRKAAGRGKLVTDYWIPSFL